MPKLKWLSIWLSKNFFQLFSKTSVKLITVSIGLSIILILALYITDISISIWNKLKNATTSFWIIYGLIIVLISSIFTMIVLCFFQKKQCNINSDKNKKIDLVTINDRITEFETAGIPVAGIRKELEELKLRRETGEIVIAIFGEISTGKSSLISSLFPTTDINIDVRGGTTKNFTYYSWLSRAGDKLVLVDLPGFNDPNRSLDLSIKEEALRAHIIVYVCDGDLTRDQYNTLMSLSSFGTPIIVALNKIDRYTEYELEQINNRITQLVGEQIKVVMISSGRKEEVTRIYDDGREDTIFRESKPQVTSLQNLLQYYLDNDPQVLNSLRDTSVFVLVQQKLDKLVIEYRREQSIKLVQTYSKKAVFGAMAAVSPGTDILIQSYLGINLIKELCSLYSVKVKDIDVQNILNLVGSKTKGNINLLLALVGNILKAFPGVGTVMGGMIHAIVYGLIFESLGKAVAISLESRGDLVTAPTLRIFEDNLSEDFEARTKSLAHMVWNQSKG